MKDQENVVIVGAGVAGLTTALMLAQSRPSCSITIVAKYMPGDEAVDYTSPWAGANYLPVSTKDSREAKWDEATFPRLMNLVTEHPEAGVNLQPAILWNRDSDKHDEITDWFKELISARPWFAEMVPEFRQLTQDELPPGFKDGITFQTICINVPVYLEYLMNQLQSRDVAFRKAELNHICDAAKMHTSGNGAQVVVNCTGLMAAKLGGVADKAVFPARGQLCIVRNQVSGLYTTSGTDDGAFETMYVQPRMDGATVIGGSYQKHDWSGEVDYELGQRIMQRAVKLCPELTGGKGPEALDVIRHVVGLRPVRTGGTRLEKENIDGVQVVHNYGHGGFGYQCSYGCSQDAVDLIEGILQEYGV